MFYNYTMNFIEIVFNCDNEVSFEGQDKGLQDAFARKI